MCLIETSRVFKTIGTYSTGLNLGNEDKHKLILINPRTHPEDDGSSNGYYRGKQGEHQTNGAHEELENEKLNKSEFDFMNSKNIRCLN
jgi:hypothetical protein